MLLAVQWSRKESAAASVSSREGRVVLTPVNPLRDGPDGIEVIDTGGRQPGEVVASLVPGARPAEGFNTYLDQVLSKDPAVGGGRRAVLLAGDGAEAKRKVAEPALSCGFQPVDTGTPAEGGSLFDRDGPEDAPPCR